VHTNLSIAAIAHRWGFCDASHFGREFRRHLSLSPGDYREAHGTPRSSEVGIATRPRPEAVERAASRYPHASRRSR
jgi:AraC-like DNA-binding protein